MGFITFLRNLFKRETRNIVEEVPLNQFPPTEHQQQPPAHPSCSERGRPTVHPGGARTHTSKPPTAPPKNSITPPSLPAPPSGTEKEGSIIPAADTHIHTPKPPPTTPPKYPVFSPLQPLPAPPSSTEREGSIIPTADTQIHTPKPPPTAPPEIKIIPPSPPATISYQGKLSQEDLVPSQRVYPPELRRQVDDEIVDSEEGSDCDVPAPDEPVPPYTRFSPDPRAGITSRTGHTYHVQPHPAFIPVYPINLYHPSHMPYQEAEYTYLQNGLPPPRDPRNLHRREQVIQLHSYETPGGYARNTQGYSHRPRQT